MSGITKVFLLVSLFGVCLSALAVYFRDAVQDDEAYRKIAAFIVNWYVPSIVVVITIMLAIGILLEE